MGTKFKAFIAIGALALGGTAAASAWRSASPCPLQAQAQAEAKEHLDAWDVTSVEVKDRSLIIKMNVGHLTEELYISVMTDGLCSRMRADTPLKEMTEVQVLNRPGGRGYIYQTDLSDCRAFVQRPEGDARTTFDILSRTRMQAPDGVGL